jgi:hypothetical protein
MVVLVSWNTNGPLAHHSSQFGSLKLDEEKSKHISLVHAGLAHQNSKYWL